MSASSEKGGEERLLSPSAGRLGFPKTVRLKHTGDFQKLKREGTSFHGRFMVLSVLESAPALKVGFITSRRVGGAVIRNRVRRQLREIVRVDRPRFGSVCWLVLIARQKAAGAEFEELRREWRSLATRAGVLRVEP